MNRPLDRWLLTGGALSLSAAALHLACIAGGPDWYRFLGAGEGMAQAAAAGSLVPAMLTFVIAVALSIAGAYALSGAGVAIRLPLRRTALVIISAVYCLRGAALFFPGVLRRPDLSASFIGWSSAIALTIGLIHGIGTARSWPSLNRKG